MTRPIEIRTRLAAGGCAALLVLALLASVASAGAKQGSKHEVAKHVFGRRYCEIFLVRKTATAYAGDVYNTYGLNNCPEAKWKAIDTAEVAKANNALAAVENGPRYWLMNQIEKLQHGSQVIKNLGGLRMIMEATITLPTLSTAPYTIHRVNRQTVWVYNAGQTVYQLHSPDGSTWVMQSWSQQIDATLSHADLATLRSKLQLPAGWSYHARVLKHQLRIVTTHADAQVLQDNLDDTYSHM
jgi:hypothetical protein